MGEWISVDERLPDPGTFVLVCSTADGKQVVYRTYFSCQFYPSNNITHWMPLPEPPK